MKSVRILSFSGSYFPAFGLNTERNSGKYGPEKLRIWALFTQCHFAILGLEPNYVVNLVVMSLAYLTIAHEPLQN